MEEQDKRVTQYLVPANVSTRFEFFTGFGWSELKIVVIACLIGSLMFFGLGLFKKTIYLDNNNIPIEMRVGANEEDLKPNQEGFTEKQVPIIPSILRIFTIIIPGVGAFFLVKREPSSGLSIIYTLKSSREFKRKQRLYLYKYKSGTEV